MEIKNISYLRKIEPELKKIAKDHNLEKEQLEELVDEFFITLKGFMEDPRMPRIKLTNFGTFKPSLRKINHDIRRSMIRYRAGLLKREFLVDKIKRLWPIRNRLINEWNGVHTWDEWKNRSLVAEKYGLKP